MKIKELSTQELADFLGMTRQGLKKTKDCGNLEGKLLEKSLKLIKSEKQGRRVVYFLEEVIVIPKEEWNVYMKREFKGVRKVDSYGDYCEERLVKNTAAVAVKEISNKVGVSCQTVGRWDNLLVRKGIMSDNGYSYFHIKNKNTKPIQITYGEYLQFWQGLNRTTIEEEKLLGIVEGEEKITREILYHTLEGTCIKVKSYLVNEFTDAYEALINALVDKK